jgi:hypothetical protein
MQRPVGPNFFTKTMALVAIPDSGIQDRLNCCDAYQRRAEFIKQANELAMISDDLLEVDPRGSRKL